MRKKKKFSGRMLSLALSVAMVFTMTPLGAFAQEDAIGATGGSMPPNEIGKDVTWSDERILDNDMTLGDGEKITLGAKVTVKGHVTLRGGANSSFIRGTGNTGVLFSIEKGATLTLENITLDGGGTNSGGTWGGLVGNSICYVKDGGTLVLNDGAVVQNQYIPSTVTGLGGFDSGAAIHVCAGGALTMMDGSLVRDGYNNKMNYAAGICNQGSFTMNGGKISGFIMATQGGCGGGVGNMSVSGDSKDGTFIMNGGEISGNSANYLGGGVSNNQMLGPAVFTMNGGMITNNKVTGGYNGKSGGGGVYTNGTMEMKGGRITENKEKGVNPVSGGGGIFVDGSNGTLGKLTMDGGTISSNSAIYFGGGIYHYYSGICTINGGTISDNFLSGGSQAKTEGGGIYCNGNNAVLTLNGGNIIKNSSVDYGGGLYINRGTATMNGGTISENTATSGGGVHAEGLNGKKLSFLGGTISENDATAKGDDFYVNANVEVGGDLQVPDGMYIANTKFLTVQKPFAASAYIGLAVATPPTVAGNQVKVAEDSASGQLTATELAHFSYDGPSNKLKLESDGIIYAVAAEPRPAAAIDYEAEKLTGLVAGAAYLIDGNRLSADGSGHIAIDPSWMGTTISIVKKGATLPDSAVQGLTIPARPATPALSVTYVSRLNRLDGAISGVTDKMKYSTDGAIWMAIPSANLKEDAFTGLAPATYQLRVAASNPNKNFRSPTAQAIVYAKAYAIVNTPLNITSTSAALGGEVKKGSNNYNASLSYRIVGSPSWTTVDSVASQFADKTFSNAIISLVPDTEYQVKVAAVDTANLQSESLLRFRTAKTTPPQGSIEVGVAGNSPRDVVVSVQRGNTVLVSVSGRVDSGRPFTTEFTGLSDGVYNVVCASEDFVETRSITIQNGAASEKPSFTLPAGNTNTVVKIVTGDTPSVAVGGMPSLITSEDQSSVVGGGIIEYTMLAEKKAENDAHRADDLKTLAESKGKDSALYYIDFSIQKSTVTTNGAVTEIPVTNSAIILEIAIPIPENLAGKENLVVYRAHDNEPAEAMTKLAAPPSTPPSGEGFYVDDAVGYVWVYAKKFSTYALAHDLSPQTSSTGGGSGSSVYTITASAGAGGSISPSGKISIHRNGEKTFTITPSDGFEISAVLVDGKRVGRVGAYTFKNVTASHTIEARFLPGDTSGLAYYLKDDKEVFIGFAVGEGLDCMYLAPEGAEVLFKPNPKRFTDIGGHWGKDNIDFVTQREVFVGTANTLFSPDTGMTRAMFATVVGRLYERSHGQLSPSGEHGFVDVNYGSWYGAYVDWCAEVGIIKGIGANCFDPNRQVTRQEMAAMLARFAAFMDKVPEPNGQPLAYADAEDIADWAKGSAAYCQQTDIILGRSGGNFAPRETATRAEVAAMIQRFVTVVVLETKDGGRLSESQ